MIRLAQKLTDPDHCFIQYSDLVQGISIFAVSIASVRTAPTPPTAVQYCARIYRPSFRENKPKTLVSSDTKRAFWACFRENWVYNFGHWNKGAPSAITYLILVG